MIAQTPGEVVIPRRQPSFADVSRRKNAFGRALGMFGSELSEPMWRELGEGFMAGDPPADRVVEWMIANGVQATRALLDRAVHGGIDSVPEAPTVLRDFFAGAERKPAWFDAERFAEGARMCQLAGNAGFFVLRDGGLMPGYLATSINRTLILTGALQRGARRRMAETMKWWLDCTADGGMDLGKPGWNATLHVRFMHAFVRRRVQKMPEWKNEEWGIPVNQSDMAGTYLVFAITFLLGLRVVGVPITEREGRAVVHFWKYVSWLMGVDERWLVDTEAEGRKLLWHVALGHAELHPNSAELGQALMNEPLDRPYEDFAWLRGRFAREQHLSVTRLFLNGDQMRALGLPRHVLPWYPLISLPFRLLRHAILRLLPKGKARLVRTGRAEQVALVERQFGREIQAMGALKPCVRGPTRLLRPVSRGAELTLFADAPLTDGARDPRVPEMLHASELAPRVLARGAGVASQVCDDDFDAFVGVGSGGTSASAARPRFRRLLFVCAPLRPSRATFAGRVVAPCCENVCEAGGSNRVGDTTCEGHGESVELST